jgi:hypothetical protein
MEKKETDLGTEDLLTFNSLTAYLWSQGWRTPENLSGDVSPCSIGAPARCGELAVTTGSAPYDPARQSLLSRFMIHDSSPCRLLSPLS